MSLLQRSLPRLKTEQQKVHWVEDVEATRWERAKKDPFFFCFDLATTMDEHDKDAPFKSLPRPLETPHKGGDPADGCWIYWTIHTWLTVDPPLLLVPKSRQMQETWVMIFLHLWLAMTFPAQRIYLQSKKEDDAKALLKRSVGVFERLPSCAHESMRAKMTTERMEFGANHSILLPIPSGGDQIRMHTPSAIFSDEFAFQEQCEEAYVAAQPCVEGGGRYTAVSSAAPSFMQELVEEPAREAA